MRSPKAACRALEVTMTVPRAIELIAEIAPTLPSDFLFGAGTRGRCRHRASRRSTPARSSSSARCSGPRSSRPRTKTASPSMPGCFTPTEILDAWDLGADIVKVFPATSVGPGYLKDIRGPLPQVKLMPTGGVSIDNVGDWLRAGAVAVGVGSALARYEGDRGETVRRDRRQRTPHGRQRRRSTRDTRPWQKSSRSARSCCGSARRDSSGFFSRRCSGATFGGGEANVAVSLAQFGLDSYYVTRLPKHDIGEAAVRALRAEGVKTDFILRGGDRIGVYFVEAGASQRASNVIYDRARFGHQRARARNRGLGEGVSGRRLVSRDRHHAGARREGGRVHARGDRSREEGRREGVGRSEFPQEALDRGAGAEGDAAADGVTSMSSSPTRKTSSRCSGSKCRTPMSRPGT